MLLKIDWGTLLLGEEDWNFLYEVLLRSAVMFLVAITAMRAIGRRGTKQGVFELVLIITLGSAAGDGVAHQQEQLPRTASGAAGAAPGVHRAPSPSHQGVV